VVKVRTFTAPPNSPAAHRGLWSAFFLACYLLEIHQLGIYFLGGSRAIYREEGLRGLWRGTSLALVGVSNGALQFMAYEKMKSWAFERRRRRLDKLGRAWTMEDEKLVKYTHPPKRPA
jgi:solute carrier family 25 folate transporter 32